MKGPRQGTQPGAYHPTEPHTKSGVRGRPGSRHHSQFDPHNDNYAPYDSGYQLDNSGHAPDNSSHQLSAEDQFRNEGWTVPQRYSTADNLRSRDTCRGRKMNTEGVPDSFCAYMARTVDNMEDFAVLKSVPGTYSLILRDESSGVARSYRVKTTLRYDDSDIQRRPMVYSQVEELDPLDGGHHSGFRKFDTSVKATEGGGVLTRLRPWGRYALYAGGAAVASAGLLIGLGALAANPDFDATKAATSIYGATSDAASNVYSWAYPKAEAIGASAVSAGSHAKSAASSSAQLLGRGIGNAWSTLGSMASAVSSRSAAWVSSQVAKENEDKSGLKRFLTKAMAGGTGVLSYAGRFWKADSQLDPSEKLGTESACDAPQGADDVEVSQE